MMISVCVSTYGGDEWEQMALRRAAPSAERQDAHEVIVVHQPDGTIGTSRNAAAAQATGEFLIHLDADDELAPGYLDAMREEIGKHDDPSMLLFTPSVQQVHRRPAHYVPFFFPECSFETGNWIVIGTLVRRDFFHQVGGFHEHPHGLEDWNLWARCVRAGATVIRVPDAVYIAHFNQRSKHHVLGRNRKAYLEAYEIARMDAWA